MSIIRPTSVAAALSLLLAASPTAAQVTLEHEYLRGTPANTSVTSFSCDPFGTSTFSYAASGVVASDPSGAPAPFPGTFEETGTVTIGPQLTGDPLVFAAAPILAFEAEFTIHSGDAVITGTKVLTVNELIATNKGFCSDGLISFGAAARYEAFIPVPGGTWVERGDSGDGLNADGPPPYTTRDSYEWFVVPYAPAARLVRIDVKPGSDPNAINLGSGGVVPVAIFGDAGFDATTIDPLTVSLASAPVRLRGNGTPQANVTDVDGDGWLDLVVHVDTSALVLSDVDVAAVLRGKTASGADFEGADTIRVVP